MAIFGIGEANSYGDHHDPGDRAQRKATPVSVAAEETRADTRPRGSSSSQSAGWRPIARRDLAGWNERLRATAAHLYQYPLWNEALRQAALEPNYFCYGDGSEDTVFVCVLTLRLPGFRYGVVRCGPVSLRPDGSLPERAIAELVPYTRRLGYMCLRFSTADDSLRGRLGQAGTVLEADTFPFLGHFDHELVVEQESEDDELLKSFQKGLRYDIRKAIKAEYTVTQTHDSASLRVVWPLVEAMDRRKGRRIYRRSLRSYERLVDLATATGAATIYSVSIDDQPIEFVLLVRDRDTSHYVAGAMDVERLGKLPSPSAFLHWTAMREAHRAGVKGYNLGTEGDEGLRVFKMKFRPTKVSYEAPFSLVLRPRRHALWTWMLRRLGRATSHDGR
ncbi:MAG: GNAT family N-acetyltransferase [Gemmatimonadota bacterium]|nr:GNAT family N-acetyltransferase [Gemmatimonadota bacterium]